MHVHTFVHMHVLNAIARAHVCAYSSQRSFYQILVDWKAISLKFVFSQEDVKLDSKLQETMFRRYQQDSNIIQYLL